jgi:transcriptional regulator with XRE-family HTH domain
MAKQTANFWRQQREALSLSQFRMAVRLDCTPASVSLWELDRQVPGLPIKKLAEGYEVSEKRIGEEIIITRRRIEDAREKELVSK